MEKERLAKLAIKGDSQAFTKLVIANKESLYRTAYAYLKDKDEALDIVQDTVYKAYISINKLKKPKYFNTWIMRILINNCLNAIKKNKKVIYMENKEFVNIVDNNIKDKDESLYVWEAIDSLKDKHKDVIILKYFNDLTVEQIADILECPVGTVKTYLNRGLGNLRKFMAKESV